VQPQADRDKTATTKRKTATKTTTTKRKTVKAASRS
jgi:hypothetical protein